MNDNSPISKVKVACITTLKGHNAAVYALSRFQNKDEFLSAGGDGWVAQWTIKDEENGKLLAKTEASNFSMNYNKEDNILSVGDIHGDLHIVKLDENNEARKIAYHKKGIFGIYRLEEALLTLAGDGMLTKWDVKSMAKKESIQLSFNRIRGFAEAKKRNFLVIGSSDKNIYFIEKEGFIIKETVKQAHLNSIFALALDKEEKVLLSGGRDAELKVWGWEEELVLMKSIPAHLFTINAIKYSPDQRLFATASRDKTIKIWDSKEYKLLKVLEAIRDKGHVNSVNDLLWLSNDRLISCSDDRTIKVWDVQILD